jgi:hypothetical protein
MARSGPDAGDKNKDGSDSSLRKPDAENLSRSVTDSSMRETDKKPTSKDDTADKNLKDVAIVDDKTADKFLSVSSVQATLAAHVPALSAVAQQDPTTAATYPQWADWHAEQNEKSGETEAAETMKEQAKKAKEAIEKAAEQAAETSDEQAATEQSETES